MSNVVTGQHIHPITADSAAGVTIPDEAARTVPMRVAPDETVRECKTSSACSASRSGTNARTGPHSRRTADPMGQSYIDSGTLPQLERAIAPESLPAAARKFEIAISRLKYMPPPRRSI